MNSLVKWAVAAAATGMLLVAANAACGMDFPHVTELEAASFGYLSPGVQSHPHRWRAAVTRANLAVNQSVAGRLSGQRVRLKFANGGWIEFQPTPVSIAGDSLPRILAIQFPRAAKAARAAVGG